MWASSEDCQTTGHNRIKLDLRHVFPSLPQSSSARLLQLYRSRSPSSRQSRRAAGRSERSLCRVHTTRPRNRRQRFYHLRSGKMQKAQSTLGKAASVKEAYVLLSGSLHMSREVLRAFSNKTCHNSGRECKGNLQRMMGKRLLCRTLYTPVRMPR